jgi:hypothetical protein
MRVSPHAGAPFVSPDIFEIYTLMTNPWDVAVVITTVEREQERLEPMLIRCERAGIGEVMVLKSPLHRHPAEGCLTAHRNVMAQAERTGGTWLVLEDDATFVPHFQMALEHFVRDVPADWEALWLGGRHNADPISVSPGVLKVTSVRRTHAYMVRGEAPSELIRTPTWGMYGLRHVDWIFSGTLGSRGHTYAPSPWLVGQGEGWSDIASTFVPARWS